MTSSPSSSWNPRYLAYCRVHGMPDPDAMLALDTERWPGGKMCGFMLWISEQWAAFTAAHPHNTEIRDDSIQAAFDEWLKGQVENDETYFVVYGAVMRSVCSILAAFALVGSWAGIGSPGGCGA